MRLVGKVAASATLPAIRSSLRRSTWPFTPRGSPPKLVATLAHFSYVAFLALGLYEAAWIAKRLADAEAPTWCLFVVLGAALWSPAVGFVGYEFALRARDIPTLWRTK
jgi:uncharacterized membrane protein YhaH (DUF805 family)